MLTKAPTIFATTTMQQHIPPLLLRSSIWIFLYLTFPTSTIAFNLGAALRVRHPKSWNRHLICWAGLTSMPIATLWAWSDVTRLQRMDSRPSNFINAQMIRDRQSWFVCRDRVQFVGVTIVRICVCRLWLCFFLFLLHFPFLPLNNFLTAFIRIVALGWRSTDDYSSSSNAWLWFQQNNKNVRVPILQGGNAAIFDYATGGPWFGSADLLIGSPQAAVMGGFAGMWWIES